jgi:hypothetical protein
MVTGGYHDRYASGSKILLIPNSLVDRQQGIEALRNHQCQ